MNMDWPVKHHYMVLAGIQRYQRECGRWECTIDPYVELSLAGRREDFPHGIVGRLTPRAAESACKAGVPLVNTWLNSPVEGVPTVTHDPEESGRIVARHLLERGFRSFGHLGFANDRNVELQLAGFRGVLEGRSHTCSQCLVSPRYEETIEEWQAFQEQMRQWVECWTPPIGVLSIGDVLCRYLTDICQRRSLRLPGDVSLVGSHNELVISAYARPTLSSIDFGFEEVGYRAAKLLDELIDGAPPPTAPIRVPPAGLVVRQSSEAFCVDDPVVAAALQFISMRLHQPIDIEEVAAHVFAGRQTLLRLFRKALGQTVHEAITHMRLERVKERLMQPGAVLKTVAKECGFRDATHLYKVFEHVEGVSPSEYRRSRETAKE